MRSTTANNEPIFWTSTAPNYNDQDRVRFTMVDGERVLEKVPQRGHVGDYDAFVPAPGRRFVTVLRHDGHIVFSILTNGAAHMDPHTAYGQYIQMKHRALGWFGMGECPCALVSAQRFSKECLVDKSLRGAQACQPGTYNEKSPCPHAIAERDARRAKQLKITETREAGFKTKEDKVIEGQNKLVEMLAQQATGKASAPPEIVKHVDPTKKKD